MGRKRERGRETKLLDPACDGAEARRWEGLFQGHV